MRLNDFKLADETLVKNLYALSQRSIIALIAFSLLLTYFLYPSLSSSIVLWEAIVLFVAGVRLFLAYDFQNNPRRFSIDTWYKIFVFLTSLAALLFAFLGFWTIFYVNEVEQVFIAASLIGLTSGALSSLFPDFRIVVGYISIIVIPLISSLISLNTLLGTVLALLLILYYAAQIIIILSSHRQNRNLVIQQDEVFREKEKLYKEKENVQHFFEQAPIGIFAYDLALKVTDCNEAFLELFGLEKAEILGRNLNDLPDKRPINTIRNALTQGVQTYVGPYTSLKNFEYWIEAKCFPLYDDTSAVTGGIGIIEDKTKEHKAVNELKFLAEHDPLTNLLNRRGFMEYMKRLVSDKVHGDSYSLLFYLDLDQFKGINDSLGHTVGDKVLLFVSQRLLYMLNNTCKIIRLSGDEFIVIVPYVTKEKNALSHIIAGYEKKLIALFDDPFIINDFHLRIKASIGMIVIEPNYSNIEEIIRHADITMYQAKNSNAVISYYNESLDIKQKEFFALQHDLSHALEGNEFYLFLQPIVKIKDDQLYSAEALIRWEHPTKGLLSPSDFIPLAIKAGILSQITWWVMDTICYYIAQLKKENRWQLKYISINVNAQQLIENDFANKFLSKLEAYALATSDVMIEITERSLIDSFDATQEIINRLRDKGVKCAVDDFGIGYSSLSYLKKLSFNTLKIDREFVKDIESNPHELLLVSTILDIGRQFNYNIVIEGIEDLKQKELLVELDPELCYQGYHFSKPLHIEDFTKKFL